MANDIKITMLGASGTSKTCFMIGMYAAMREGVRGFTFSTSDWDLDLKLDEDWERILNGEGRTAGPHRPTTRHNTIPSTLTMVSPNSLALHGWIIVVAPSRTAVALKIYRS